MKFSSFGARQKRQLSPSKQGGAAMACLKDSKDGKKHERAKKSATEETKDAEAKSQKKVNNDATQREKNSVNFPTSSFHHSNPAAVVPSQHTNPNVKNNAVKLHGILC
jgi:hypothetical protein